MKEKQVTRYWLGSPNRKLCGAEFPERIAKSFGERLEIGKTRRALVKLVESGNALLGACAKTNLFYVHRVVR